MRDRAPNDTADVTLKRDETIDGLIRRFNKIVMEHGITGESRRRLQFETNREKRVRQITRQQRVNAQRANRRAKSSAR